VSLQNKNKMSHTKEEVEAAEKVIQDAQLEEEKQFKLDEQKWINSVEKCLSHMLNNKKITKTWFNEPTTLIYNLRSQLDFGRTMKSCMLFEFVFEDGTTLLFGPGECRDGDKVRYYLTLPNANKSKYNEEINITHGWLGHKVYGYQQLENPEKNRKFWIMAAKHFKFKLIDFEAALKHFAKQILPNKLNHSLFNVCSYDEKENCMAIRAPIKQKIVTYKWN
jgi:hypothetical protein